MVVFFCSYFWFIFHTIYYPHIYIICMHLYILHMWQVNTSASHGLIHFTLMSTTWKSMYAESFLCLQIEEFHLVCRPTDLNYRAIKTENINQSLDRVGLLCYNTTDKWNSQDRANENTDVMICKVTIVWEMSTVDSKENLNYKYIMSIIDIIQWLTQLTGWFCDL